MFYLAATLCIALFVIGYLLGHRLGKKIKTGELKDDDIFFSLLRGGPPEVDREKCGIAWTEIKRKIERIDD